MHINLQHPVLLPVRHRHEGWDTGHNAIGSIYCNSTRRLRVTTQHLNSSSSATAAAQREQTRQRGWETGLSEMWDEGSLSLVGSKVK
jgi:hypothetical protein